MQALNLPSFPLRHRKNGERTEIFDAFRKKWLLLTPEEWVRQHIARYLVEHLDYSASLMSLEKEINVSGRKRRVDILCYSKEAKPLLLVECKAPEIKITQAAFDQITRYNISLEVPVIVVSNGINHYCALFDVNSKKYHYIDSIPNRSQI